MLRAHRRFVLVTTLVSVVLTVGVSSPAFAAGMVDLDLTPWGMTREDVAKALHVSLPEAGKDMVLSGGSLQGHEAATAYVFTDNRLSAVHVHTVAGISATAASVLREELRSRLVNEYGTPTVEQGICQGRKRGCSEIRWTKNDTTMVRLQKVEKPPTVIYASVAATLRSAVTEAIREEYLAMPPVIEVRRADPKAVLIDLTLPELLASDAQAEKHGRKAIIGAMMALLPNDINPRDGKVELFVSVYAPKRQDPLRLCGIARYEASTDTIHWEAADSGKPYVRE